MTNHTTPVQGGATEDQIEVSPTAAFEAWFTSWWKNTPNVVARSNALTAFFAGWEAGRAAADAQAAGGDHEALIAEARSRAEHLATGSNVAQCLRECADALAARVQTDVEEYPDAESQAYLRGGGR